MCEREETRKICLFKFLCGSHSLCLAQQTLVWYMFAFHVHINCLLPLWCPLLLPPTSSLALAEQWYYSRWGLWPFWQVFSFSGSLSCIHVINFHLIFLLLKCLMLFSYFDRQVKPRMVFLLTPLWVWTHDPFGSYYYYFNLIILVVIKDINVFTLQMIFHTTQIYMYMFHFTHTYLLYTMLTFFRRELS